MVRLSLMALLAGAVACSPPPPRPDGGTGGGRGGGTGGGNGISPFGVTVLDATAREKTYTAIAVDPVLERVGVAYYTPAGTETNIGHPDYDLKYVEWRQGAVVGPPERIRTSQRLVGLTVAFDPANGEPVVGYLGGAPSFQVDMSIFWFQSDASLARRNGGTWTETIIANAGNEVTCGNPVSDRGFLVGLWPSIVYDSTGKMYYGYRDGHGGQFPMQDWAGTDVEVWEGSPVPTVGVCAAAGGNNKDALGGHLRLFMGPNDQPAMVYDQMFGTADTNGKNVIFQRRLANGMWTPPSGSLVPISNTQTGPVAAYDDTEGFGIAFFDLALQSLSYLNSADGMTWNALDPVFNAGSGGWFPSLAMDPINHEPAIAFYVCSPRSGISETSCNTNEDELRVTQRIAGIWRETLVDSGGGHAPKLAFFASGKRVLVYQTPSAVDPGTGLTVSDVGTLKIAVER